MACKQGYSVVVMTMGKQGKFVTRKGYQKYRLNDINFDVLSIWEYSQLHSIAGKIIKTQLEYKNGRCGCTTERASNNKITM